MPHPIAAKERLDAGDQRQADPDWGRAERQSLGELAKIPRSAVSETAQKLEQAPGVPNTDSDRDESEKLDETDDDRMNLHGSSAPLEATIRRWVF
jgi:hypothetical protein